MTTTITVERCFDLTWPPWQPPSATGLVALIGLGATAAWADGLLARYRDGSIVWAATATHPTWQAMTVATLPHVHAVVLTPRGSDARKAALALEFACHLTAIRGLPDSRPSVTSPVRPVPSDQTIRIPHLVTISRAGAVTDTVVWELIARDHIPGWLGGPLPDQQYIEAHLPDLLRLRAAARAGRLPLNAAGRQLAELLHERYLSIRLVYQHPDLFYALLGHDGGRQ